jgi:hypothetical protein
MYLGRKNHRNVTKGAPVPMSSDGNSVAGILELLGPDVAAEG